MFHLRWVLLLSAPMAAVINPVVTSPFVYALPLWSPAIQARLRTRASCFAWILVCHRVLVGTYTYVL